MKKSYSQPKVETNSFAAVCMLAASPTGIGAGPSILDEYEVVGN